jgi:hypothetical protein
MVENETLEKEINELTLALGKAYGGEDRLLMCLGSQRASLYKEGLGYTPKKGKAAFAPHKTSFVKKLYASSYVKIITCKLYSSSIAQLYEKNKNIASWRNKMEEGKPLFSPNPLRSQALLVAQPSPILLLILILFYRRKKGGRRRKGGREE